jgi:hypothetical protein
VALLSRNVKIQGDPPLGLKEMVGLKSANDSGFASKRGDSKIVYLDLIHKSES